MKVCKPIKLLLPTAFKTALEKYLNDFPPQFKYDINYFYYLVYSIFVQHEFKKKDEKLMPISNKIKTVTISNIGDYKKFLINGEFIKTDKIFIKGKYMNGYEINPIYLNSKITTIEISATSKIFTKIIKEQRRKKAHINRLEPFLRQMYKAFMGIDFYYDELKKWIDEHPSDKSIYYHTSLNRIIDLRFRYFKRNKKNKRLDTNFTNCKKEFRNYIKGNFVCVDLKNSQPFFFAFLTLQLIQTTTQTTISKTIYNKNKTQNINNLPYSDKFLSGSLIKTFGIKRIKTVLKIHQNEKKAFLENLNKFKNSVFRGTLYDDFVKLYGGKIDRDNAKEIILKVLFSKNEYYLNNKKIVPYEKDKRIFASVYPIIYEVIMQLKNKDNTILPVFLQQMESYIFIDCIAKELVNAGIVPLTIHDSVIVKAEQQQKTIEIMNKVFINFFGVIPTFTITPLKPNN